MSPIERTQFLDRFAGTRGRISGKLVRDIFPPPPRMVIGLHNLTGRDLDADGGWQRALEARGLRGVYEPRDDTWSIVPLKLGENQ